MFYLIEGTLGYREAVSDPVTKYGRAFRILTPEAVDDFNLESTSCR